MVTTPPPPQFNDVVEAQEWASSIVTQVETEANRRGSRGSRAWEDAWRDALWTLAVQKRCVEVEARKTRSSSTASLGQGAKVPATAAVSPAPAPGALSVEETRASSFPPAHSKKPPGMDAIKDALRQSAFMLESRCLEPVQTHLNGVEASLARLSLRLQLARSFREACHKQSNQTNNQLPKTVAGLGGSMTAGRLPGVMNSTQGSAKALQEQFQRQLAQRVADVDHERNERKEAEDRCCQVDQKLRRLEADHEEIYVQLRRAEKRADHNESERSEAHTQWELRHAAVQRQLRRTEVALGEAHILGRSFATEDDGVASRRLKGHKLASSTSDVRDSTGDVSTMDSDNLLRMLRDVRRHQRGMALLQ